MNIDWNLVSGILVALGIYKFIEQVVFIPLTESLIAKNAEYRRIARKTYYFIYNNFYASGDLSKVRDKDIDELYRYSSLVEVSDKHLADLIRKFVTRFKIMSTLDPDKDTRLYFDYRDGLYKFAAETLDICNAGRFATIVDLNKWWRNFIFAHPRLSKALKRDIQ